ncbi:MAG: alanine--tRNA ligase-related protein, partial [Candidatus Ratteibacteria bacterium]
SDKGYLTGIYKGENRLYYLIFDRTPFYPEKGGQIGDRGEIFNDNFKFEVIDTQIDENGLIYHIGKVQKGEVEKLKIKDEFNLKVDQDFRKKVSINHTATHLLHYALREIIGKDVRQAGSYVGDDKLRFDFICFSDLNDEIIEKVENLVCEKIFEKAEVKVEEMSLNEAVEKGAIALFTEKYGEKVRVVSTGEFHKEVCGGTHLKNTGDIFLFHIASFSTIGKNLKRIEAITYKKCLEYFVDISSQVKKISNLLKVEERKIVNKIEKMVEDMKEKERMIEKYVYMNVERIASEILKNPKRLYINEKEINLFYSEVDIEEKENVARISDIIAVKEKKSVVFLISRINGKRFFVLKIGEELKDKISAIKIIKNLSKYIKGGGNERFASGIIEEKFDTSIILKEVIESIKEYE